MSKKHDLRMLCCGCDIARDSQGLDERSIAAQFILARMTNLAAAIKEGLSKSLSDNRKDEWLMEDTYRMPAGWLP